MKPTRVEIEKKLNLDGSAFYVVAPYFDNVDRPNTVGYSCGKNIKIAQRLSKAFLDGIVVSDPHLNVDVNGKSYVSFFFPIRMRCVNADLKKLGY